jgi:hypothetical protein
MLPDARSIDNPRQTASGWWSVACIALPQLLLACVKREQRMHTAVALIALPVLSVLAALQMSSKAENKTRDLLTMMIIATLITLGNT